MAFDISTNKATIAGKWDYETTCNYGKLKEKQHQLKQCQLTSTAFYDHDTITRSISWRWFYKY